MDRPDLLDAVKKIVPYRIHLCFEDTFMLILYTTVRTCLCWKVPRKLKRKIQETRTRPGTAVRMRKKTQ
jgi:hypothetical protein